MGIEKRTPKSIRRIKTKNHRYTLLSPLQLRLKKYSNHGRKSKGARRNAMARTAERSIKTDRICKQIYIGHRTEIRNKRTRAHCRGMGPRTFQALYLR